MAKFKPGDVCEIVITPGNYNSHYNGAETTIVKLDDYVDEDYPGQFYEIDLTNPQSGTKWLCPEVCLRLKKPPAQYLGEIRVMELFNVDRNPVKVVEECAETVE